MFLGLEWKRPVQKVHRWNAFLRTDTRPDGLNREEEGQDYLTCSGPTPKVSQRCPRFIKCCHGIFTTMRYERFH